MGLESPLKKWHSSRGKKAVSANECPADLGFVSNAKAYSSEQHRAERRKELGDEFFTEIHAIPTSVALAQGKWQLQLPKTSVQRERKDTLSLDEQEERLRKDAGDAYTSLLQSIQILRPWDSVKDCSQKDMIAYAQSAFGFSDMEHDARLKQASVSACVLDVKAQVHVCITGVENVPELPPRARVYCTVQLLQMEEIDKKDRFKTLASPASKSAKYLTSTKTESEKFSWRDRFELGVADWLCTSVQVEVVVERDVLEEPAAPAKPKGRLSLFNLRKARAKAKRISSLATSGDKVLGRVTIKCRDMKPGKDKMCLQFTPSGKGSKPCNINVDLFVHPVAVREQVDAAARAQHRTAQHYILKHECNVQCGDDSDRMWIASKKETGLDGVLPAIAQQLILSHAKYLHVKSIQMAVDTLCATVELNDKAPISASVFVAVLQPVNSMLQAGHELEDEDEGRLVAAIESIVSWGMTIVGRPFDDIEQSSTAELAATVELLVLCYCIEPWKRATLKVSPPHPLSQFEMPPILKRAVEMIDSSVSEGEPITYIALKSQLIEEFDDDQFQLHRRELSSLLAQKTDQAPTMTSSPIMIRLQELLEQNRKSEELTYNSMKAILSREFGPSAFQANKKAISAALINEMNIRRQMTSTPEMDRNFKDDLHDMLEHYVANRYQQMLTEAKPEKDFEGSSIVVMVKTTAHICRDMENVAQFLDYPFSQIPGMPRAFVLFASWYEKLYVSDLRELLFAWSKKPNLSTLVFELYFASRQLLGTLSKYMRSHELHDLRITNFCQFFEPFVCQWIDLSQKHGERWISKSLQLETWQAMRDEDMYSTSVLDVFRALFEILEFWQKLDWPDEEAADEMLFGKLAECVCHCVQYYVHRLCDHLRESNYFVAGSTFHLPPKLCVGINNLNHTEMQLRDVFTFMRVNDVADSHAARASLFLGDQYDGRFKPHSSLSKFGATFAALSEATRDTLQVVGSQIAQQARQVLLQGLGESSPDKAIIPLIGTEESPNGYLYANLQCLVDNLQYDNASHQLVLVIWREIVLETHSMVLEQAMRPSNHFQALPEVVIRLKSFFHADGEGLQQEELETGGFIRLMQTLRAIIKPTPNLISHFFREAAALHAHHFLGRSVRAGEGLGDLPVSVVTDDGTQDEAAVMRALGSSRGALTVQLIRTDTGLTVGVLNASGLPSCPGKFDVPNAFVKVKLQPHHVFNAPRYYTDSKKSKDPVFNKTYKFNDLPKLDGLVLQCVVAHKSTGKRKLVIGEVLLDVKGVFATQSGNEVTVTMPLKSFDFLGSLADVQTILASRAKTDKEAASFASKRMLTAPLARLLARRQVSENDIEA